MFGIVFLGDRRIELREFPDPTPEAGEAVLEIRASGMCGTDLRAYRNGKPGESTQSPATSLVASWLQWARASLPGRPKSVPALWFIITTAAEFASIAERAGRKSATTALSPTDQERLTAGMHAT